MNGKRKEWIERGGDVLVMSFAVAAAMLLLSGCGQERRAEKPLAGSSTSAAPVEAVAAVATAGAPAANAALSQGSTSNGGETTLPPEIALAEMDTLVMPGQPVKITVYGTPDVAEMALSDGLNGRQPLVHDESSDTWNVDYRVPLRPKSDRIGLSVTAKNAANRWRRVWVFLHVDEGGEDCGGSEDTVAAADSSATK